MRRKKPYPKRPFQLYRSGHKRPLSRGDEEKLKRRSYKSIQNAVRAARDLAWRQLDGVTVIVHNEHRGRDLVQFRRNQAGVVLWTWSAKWLEEVALS